MSEAEFEQAVVDLAHTFGWCVAGFRPARTQKGWRTPVKYDGKGWPDLVLVHRERGVLFVEIKTDSGRLSDDQVEWKSTLEAAPLTQYHVWRPIHWDGIVRELSGGRAAA